MSEFREIRLRLNLRRQRDRWLASSPDAAARDLGAPLSSVLRRALVRYFRDHEAGSETPPRRRDDGGRRHDNGGASPGPIDTAPTERAQARAGDPLAEDDADEIEGALASLGAPPEPPRASG